MLLHWLRWLTLACLLGLAVAAWAQQSDNHILHAVPTPGKVSIDGKLDDWDLSGAIDVFANYRMRNTFSTKVAAMYDKEYFYLSIRWRAPYPMLNNVDPTFDVGNGWRGDCVQLRLLTDLTMHIDCWYATTVGRPVVKIDYGSFQHGPQSPTHTTHFKPLPDAIAAGALEAFQMGEDGKSYTQEIALPWKLITGHAAINKDTGQPYAEAKTYRPGDTFHLGMEFLWAPPDGKSFPAHRYADLLQEGSGAREFFWQAEKAWGTVVLEPKGHLHLSPVDYSDKIGVYLQKSEGPVALSYTMPYDGFATLVIDDAAGHRVKNLIGMASRSKGPQVDYWDGTDDSGKLATPGAYHWRGLAHQGIDPVYEASYGSPGVPPWDTADGAGAWLSDHNPPNALAIAKERVVLGSYDAESGWDIICTDLNGRKKWGDRTFHGITNLGIDDKHVFVLCAPWGNPPPPVSIARLDVQTGKFAPFTTKTGAQETFQPLKPEEGKAWIAGIAAGGNRLAVSITGSDMVRFFDKETAALLGELPVAKVGCLTYDSAGTLYVFSGATLMKVIDGKLLPVIREWKGAWVNSLGITPDGHIYLADQDANQVQLYDSAGKFIRTIGMPGGRPTRGAWQANGMLKPAAIGADALGRVWVAEMDATPKRISVWGADGALITDYIGPTGYGGTGASADPDDKTRVFGSGCEFKLDYATNKAAVVTVLGQGDGAWLKAQGREYYMTLGGELFLRTGTTGLRRVAAFGTLGVKDMGHVEDIPLPAPPKGEHGYSSMTFLWSDLNDDGKVEPAEVINGSRWAGWNELKYPIGVAGYFGSYWLDEQFNLYGYARESFGGWGGRGPFVTKIPLKGWTPGGAPIWDVTKQQLLYTGGLPGGSCLYLPDKGKVIFGEPLTCVDEHGTVLWSYGRDMFAGVHGSHDAFIPERDDIMIGSLGCIGHADSPLGAIFAVHSNMGRLYLMTTDGLFVASVFQDTRLGSSGWPDNQRPGAPLGGITMGSEWFGGHFFKATKTHEYYLIAGFTAYNLIKLNGFDSLRALPGAGVKLTAADVIVAQQLLQQRAAKEAANNTLVIAKAPAAPVIDGKLDKYAKDSFVAWSSGPYKARAALAVDATKLYLAYDVTGVNTPRSPVNGGKDANQLFITGDSVDLQLAADPTADPKRIDADRGDMRLLISVLDNQPIAVLYRWKTAGAKTPVTFTCPWRSCTVDSVEVLKDAEITITRRTGGYAVEAAVPLATLGFTPMAGKEYKLDLGVVYADTTGDNRTARVYWANKATGIVSDVPGEIMASPNLWGKATVAK